MPPNDHSRIIFLERNLSEIGAFALERRYILWYGRKDLGTGILHNKTDGGEGASGLILSEAHKLAVSLANKGKKLKPRTDEHRAKLGKAISKALTGRKRKPFSDEHRAKLSIAAKKRITLP